MKRLIFTLLILTFAVTAHADPTATTRRDPVRFYEKSYIIRDAKGKEVGAIRPDYLRPGEYRILDSTGEQTGRIKKDVLRKGGYIFEKVKAR